MKSFPAEQGFITLAKNTAKTDYLRLAHAQALMIRSTQRCKNTAVIVDHATAREISPVIAEAFDFVIEIEDHGKFVDEPQAFYQTPFRETIKFEADLAVTRSLDHWWTGLRLSKLVLPTGCLDYMHRPSSCRDYRRVFDANSLPDVYSGMMYWRWSQTAKNFFDLATAIFENWSTVSENLVSCTGVEASTDLVYALAARILGPELCTMPSLNFFKFVHLKPKINGFHPDLTASQALIVEQNHGTIRINGIDQIMPLHYHDKEFLNDEFIRQLGSRAH